MKNHTIIKLKEILMIFWISLLVMLLMTGIEGQTPVKDEYKIQQDTIRKDTVIKKIPVQKLSKEQQKIKEYYEWQRRSQQLEENMKKMEAQSQVMDSLLGIPDTTEINKKN